MSGASIVKLDLRGLRHFRQFVLLWPETFPQHAIQVLFSRQDGVNGSLEAFPLRQIHFQSSKAVGKVKLVDAGAALIVEGSRLSDVHSTGSQRSSNGGEKERTIRSDESKFVPVAGAGQGQPHPGSVA